jgi:hypothetical protein
MPLSDAGRSALGCERVALPDVTAAGVLGARGLLGTLLATERVRQEYKTEVFSEDHHQEDAKHH